jgi:putative DNA primase/helicase
MDDNLLNLAVKYAKLRWKLHPVYGFDEKMSCTCGEGHKDTKDAGKHPVFHKWEQLSSSDQYDIKDWWMRYPLSNIALHCSKSGFFVIDIDPRSGGDESYEKLIQILDEKGINLPQTVEAITGKYSYQGKEVRGRHIYFKCWSNDKFVANLSKLDLPGIDIKHNGYVLLPGSKHLSGVTYQWFEGRDPWTIDVAEPPGGLLSLIRKDYEPQRHFKEVDWSEIVDKADKLDINKIAKEGVKEGERNNTLFRVSIVLCNMVAPDGKINELKEDMIFSWVSDFNNRMVSPPLPEDEVITICRQAIKFVRENPQTNYASPELIAWAQKFDGISFNHEEVVRILGSSVSEDESNFSKKTRLDVAKSILEEGVSVSQTTTRKVADFPKDQDAVSEEDGGVPGNRSYTDIGNARRLVDTWGAGIAYTPDIGFKVWEDGYWKTDKEGLYIQELTKKIPSFIEGEAGSQDLEMRNKTLVWAKTSRSNARIKAAIEAAKSDPRIHINLEKWDSDPELFGAKNGVINLKTGNLMKSAPSHYISIISDVQYIPGLTNDRWENFLWDTTGEDQQLIDYLQLLMGYIMTAHSYLDIISLIYGPPGTGKNTFIESCFSAMGDYAWPLDLSVISNTNGMNSGSDLYHIAELLNRRAVWVDELPEGEKLKETTLKKLSGSSLMSARSPGGRPFSFKLVAKTVISTNHRPPIQDDAMWRRLIAIPFTHKPKKIDPTLKRYLSDPEGGLPAVLAWLVEGAVKYLNSSNDPEYPFGFSKVVQESTEMYRKSEDKTGLFIDENLREKPGASVLMSAVFAEYQSWSMKMGEKFLTQASFQKKLVDRGIRVVGHATAAEIIGHELSNTNSIQNPVGKIKLYDLPESNVAYDNF